MSKKKKTSKFEFVELPPKFEQRFIELFPEPIDQIKIRKTFAKRPTTFRINTLKSSLDEVLPQLQQNGFKFDRVEWSADAFILRNRSKQDLMELSIYTDGKIYIQSLASQLPPVILEPQPEEKILDLTAAPGSKTSQMAAMMSNTGEIIANDMNKVRFFKLKHNLENLGVTNAKLRMENGVFLCREYDAYFDRILLDAPCSAESRFVLGDPKTLGYWSEPKVKDMAYTQRKLMLSAWQSLKPGGTLVYSTCTISPEENELQITKFLEKVDNAKLIPIKLPGINNLKIPNEFRNKQIPADVLQNCLRVYPTADIESFFVAKILKHNA